MSPFLEVAPSSCYFGVGSRLSTWLELPGKKPEAKSEWTSGQVDSESHRVVTEAK